MDNGPVHGLSSTETWSDPVILNYNNIYKYIFIVWLVRFSWFAWIVRFLFNYVSEVAKILVCMYFQKSYVPINIVLGKWYSLLFLVCLFVVMSQNFILV
jgi:hypothetical protein